MNCDDAKGDFVGDADSRFLLGAVRLVGMTSIWNWGCSASLRFGGTAEAAVPTWFGARA
jgi:hypothetical protein